MYDGESNQLMQRPYIGKTRKEIRDSVMSKQVQIKKTEIPPGWSLISADFINKLIQRKPVNRLGVNGPKDVKVHPWFKSMNWNRLSIGSIKAPYVPNVRY